MPSLSPNSIIGSYQLIRMLGEGGMGEVWLGKDLLADRKVALKFIKPHLLADQGFRTRFSNEARTLGKLEHDRIVSLYNVLDEGDYLALVLRFIDGQSLADKVDSQGALGVDLVLSCARDILPALGFAHDNGIIHRDIKPANIIVDSQGRCFLMDFGIAVAAFAERGTMTGLAIGTPHYMSPEQIRTPQAIRIETGGNRTDIYSFGIVLFEMLSGQVPFGQDSGMEDMYAIQHAHCNQPPPRLRDINPSVPPGIESTIMACLEKEPANRPQTCLELLNELERVAQGGGQSARAHPATIVESRSSPTPQQPVSATPVSVTPVVSSAPRKLPQQLWYGLGTVCIAGGIGFAVMNHADKPVTPVIHTSASEPVTTAPNPVRRDTGQTANDHRLSNRPITTPIAPIKETSQPGMTAAASKFAEGKALYEQGNYCGAKVKFDEAIGLNPKPEYTRFQSSAADGCNNVAP